MGAGTFIRSLAAQAVRWAASDPRFANASPENPSTNLADPASWLNDWASGGHPGTFGPPVSETTAMTCSVVFRCVTLISGIAGALPLKIYKRGPEAREEAPNHTLARFFRTAPYPGRAMTSFIWRELWLVNVLLWGNHYSIIRYDAGMRIVGFEPVMPWDVTVYRVAHRNIYRCITWDSSFGPASGGVTQKVEWIDQDDILHIPGPGFNGLIGLSRIRAFARNAVALASLLEEQTGRVHENAARPSGLVTVPSRITKEAFARLKVEFNENNTGRANAGRVIFADKDSEYTPFQMSPADLNTITQRRYQVADISRFFGVPLHLLNETEKSTSWGTGLSEQTLAFLIYTIDTDLGRIEAELNYKLFGTDYYVEFDRDALMAMDPVKSAQVAQTEIASGTLLMNERRRHKNRPPHEYGDQPLINSTNVPLAKIFAANAQPQQDPLSAVPPEPAPAEPDAPNEAEPAPDEDTEGN